jgi:Transcriptional Coactivator p15 (PC4)
MSKQEEKSSTKRKGKTAKEEKNEKLREIFGDDEDEEEAEVKDDDDGDDDEKPKKKKTTKTAAPKAKLGEAMYDIGGKKKLTLGSYKGMMLVGIREYYEDRNTGEQKVSFNLCFMDNVLTKTKNTHYQSYLSCPTISYQILSCFTISFPAACYRILLLSYHIPYYPIMIYEMLSDAILDCMVLDRNVLHFSAL